MQVLWAKSPRSADEVIAALAGQADWQAVTVRTLLNRLLRKGALTAHKEGRRYLYSPALRREQWLSDESANLLERLFAGRVAPLVAHFSRNRKLSKADIRDLKKLIQELDDGE